MRKGVNTFLCYIMEDTKLHEACKTNNLEEVKRLLTTTDDVCTLNVFENTPLHIACGNQNIDIVTAILDVNKRCIDMPDSLGYTALMIACIRRNEELIELLLSNGANPSIMTPDGETAISILTELDEKGLMNKLESMEQSLSPPMKLKRNLSMSHSSQKYESTCLYHALAKIFLQNIFKIHTDVWNPAICDTYLNTMKPFDFDTIHEACSKEKIILFYYIYFLLEETYNLEGFPIDRAQDLIYQVQRKEIPKKLIHYKPVMDPFLDTPMNIQFIVLPFDKRGNNVKLYRYIYYCLYNLKCYVGISITSYNMVKNYGHSLLLVDIDKTPKGTFLILKNSWASTFSRINLADLTKEDTWLDHVPFLNSFIRFYFILDFNSLPSKPTIVSEFEKTFIHRNTENHFGGKTKRRKKRNITRRNTFI